MNIKLEGLKDH